MQTFVWLAFLLAIGGAIFVIQNLAAPAIVMNFLFWRLEASPTDIVLESIGCGMFIILLLWIPRSIRNLFRVRNLKKRIEILESQVKHTEEEERKKP